MARTTKHSALILAAVLLLHALPQSVQAQLSIEGAWSVNEWTRDGQTTSPAQPGLFIFTSTHYSAFFVRQDEARAVAAVAGPNGMTDAEKAVAYDEFTANTGRYELDGNKLTTRAYVAKGPGFMASWPEYTVNRSGDTLTLTFANGNVATLTRREGQAPPG